MCLFVVQASYLRNTYIQYIHTYSGFVLTSELVYLIQVVLSVQFESQNMSTLTSALLAVLFVFNFWSAILMYRMWEFLLFNYDDPDPGSGTTGSYVMYVMYVCMYDVYV